MKIFFSTQWKYENILLYIMIVVSFSLIAYYILRSGFSMSSDSERYSKWADNLINLDFNLYEFLQKNFYFELSKSFEPKGFNANTSVLYCGSGTSFTIIHLVRDLQQMV